MSKILTIDRYAYLDPQAHGMPRKVLKALKRVPERDRRKPPRFCRYCGGQVVLTTHKRVYGRNKGRWPLLYRCTSCDARAKLFEHGRIPHEEPQVYDEVANTADELAAEKEEEGAPVPAAGGRRLPWRREGGSHA